MFKTDFHLIMAATGISNKELSKHINANQQSVSDWVNGHRPIPTKYRQQISDYLHVDVTSDEPFDGIDRKKIIENMLSNYFGKIVTVIFDEDDYNELDAWEESNREW